MARTEHLIHAAPEVVFHVLADPRGYAYWVLGSKEIRDVDRDWPAVGSRFHHSVGAGVLRLKDNSEVEQVQPGRFLQLKVKTRPLGTARVQLELHEAGGDTRVTMVEDPADPLTALVANPLLHRLIHARNSRSLDRLAELAEGRVPLPGEEADAQTRTPHEDGSVENPPARRRREAVRDSLAAVGRGVGAGVAGALVMSISTNTEMRLRGRRPSYAPAAALARVFGLSGPLSTRTRRRRRRLASAGQLATSVALGTARAAIGRAGLRGAPAGGALFALAMAPEAVIVPALGGSPPPWRWSAADGAITVLHHGVFALTTNVVYEVLDRRAGDGGAA